MSKIKVGSAMNESVGRDDATRNARKNSTNSQDTEEDSAGEIDTKQPRNIVKLITVEPVAIDAIFIILLYSISSKQFIHQRISNSYNFDHNRTTNDSCSGVKENQSDPYYVLEQKISSETAAWALYLNLGNAIPALVSTILLGSWGDKVGRKTPLLISLFGLIILVSCYLFVIIFRLPLPYLFIGHILCGVLGDFSNILGCCFSYLSDITTPETRTLRMAVVETSLGIGGFVATITSGLWNLEKGFQNPYWFMFGLAVFNFLYAAFLLTPNERITQEKLRHLFSKEPFLHMYNVVRPHRNKRHVPLLLFALTFCLLIATRYGIKGLIVIYAMDVPFCWNSLLVGLLSGFGQVGYFVTLILLKIFSDFSSQPKMVVLSVFASLISSVLFAFAKTAWMLFLAQFFQLFSNLPSPIVRSQSSRIVSATETGSVFALLACSMVIGDTVGSLAYQGIFAATADTAFPGAAFLASAILLLLIVPIYWLGYTQSELKDPSSVAQYDSLAEETG